MTKVIEIDQVVLATIVAELRNCVQVQQAVMESMKPARGGKVFLEG